ncbi:LytTR family DNA-binding domain-containing protein [soil metagenome]
MLKAVIIDDEERATDSLKRMIEIFVPSIRHIFICNDSREAPVLINKSKPDIIFLDIRMPHLNGFDILDHVKIKNFKVIFTTAFDHYAIQAIRFSAFDYLLKPIDAEDLVKAVSRFENAIDDDAQHHQDMVHNISLNLKLQNKNQFRLALSAREGVHFLMPGEIIRCEAQGNYTRFFVTGNKQYLISKTLGDYDELLNPYGFIRTHKSHLVNKNFISFVDHNGYAILHEGEKIEISRRRKESVMEALKQQ